MSKRPRTEEEFGSTIKVDTGSSILREALLTSTIMDISQDGGCDLSETKQTEYKLKLQAYAAQALRCTGMFRARTGGRRWLMERPVA